ncbi:trypsin-like peptidase domain-containing protein [Streptomyces luteireticuli]|uniref:nSTAND1 domain-containing NTPase n=1 Tax=Streptomyces luteireticuli TaxID=173858 RepID=UPI0031D7E2AF
MVGTDTVVTCAHVVEAAGYGPGTTMWLAFPDTSVARHVQADVLDGPWRPPNAGDIAVLRMRNTPPDSVALPLGSAEGCRGHRVRAFGFPAQAPPGGHYGYAAAGDLLVNGSAAGPLLQLTDANDLTTGFSGGPVVDEVTGLVIGMVTSIAAPDQHLKGLSLAYATPTQVLREAWPELVEQEVCPYRGLEPFTAEHADWFHGRDTAVESVLGALSEQRRMLLLLGPSGAGKSSLLQAGVLPALAAGHVPGSDRWIPLMVRPGRNLLAELERAGLPGASAEGVLRAVQRRLEADPGCNRLVLVIDQFEEVLTQSGSADEFAEACAVAAKELAAVNDPQIAVSVVLVMRDDFYPRLAALFPELLKTATPGLLNIPVTLGVPDLHAIISRPAEAIGMRIEDGLPERIITDILAASPTRQAPITLLPPLELTLSQLWERRVDGRLTHRAYQQIGGITGSLTTWCNTALRQLPTEQRPIAQRILTALVRPSDETHAVPATRQQLPLTRLRSLAIGPNSEESEAGSAFASTLSQLTRYRIITTGTSPRADGGASEPAAELIHDALIRDWGELRDWIAQNRTDLLTHQQLSEACTAWTQHGRDNGYLYTGNRLEQIRDWAASQLAQGTHRGGSLLALTEVEQEFISAAVRLVRRRKRRRLALVTLATCMALILTAVGTLAYVERGRSQQRASELASRRIAAQANALRLTDPAAAFELSLAAYRTAHTTEARTSMIQSAAFPLPVPLTGHTRDIIDVAFRPTGTTLASSSQDGTVRLWNVEDPYKPSPGPVLRTGPGTHIAWRPDGRFLIAHTPKALYVWDTSKPSRPQQVAHSTGTDSVRALALSPDGQTLVVAGDHGRIWQWNLNDLHHPVVGAPQSAGDGTARALAFSSDGHTLAAAFSDRNLQIWNAGQDHALHHVNTISDADAASLAFSPDNRQLIGGAAPTDWERQVCARIWKTDDLIRPHPSNETWLAVSDTGCSALAFRPDGKYLAISIPLADSVFSADFSSYRESGVPLLDATFPTAEHATAVTYSPEGRSLAIGSQTGPITLSNAPIRSLSGVTTKSLSSSDAPFDERSRYVITKDRGKGPVRIWRSTPTTHRSQVLATLPAAWGAADFLPGGQVLMSRQTSGDRKIKLWDFRDGRLHPGYEFTASAQGNNRPALDASPDGQLAIFNDPHANKLSIWDIRQTDHPQEVGALPADVVAAIFMGPRTVLADARTATQVWDLDTPNHPKLLTTLKGIPNQHLAGVNDSALVGNVPSPTSGGQPEYRRDLWAINHRDHVRKIGRIAEGTTRQLSLVSGQLAATLSAAGQPVLWDLKQNPLKGTVLPGTIPRMERLMASPDKRLLLAAKEKSDGGRSPTYGSIGAFGLWRVADPTDPHSADDGLLALLTEPTSQVQPTNFSPDGTTLLLTTFTSPPLEALDAQTIQIDTDFDRLSTTLCSVHNKPMSDTQWRKTLPGLSRKAACP